VKSALLRAVLASLAAAPFLFVAAAHAAQPRVLAVHFGGDTEVNPVTQDYVNHEIQHANNAHYDAVVILLDTPGGLSTSMRKIYQKELASKIPVIVYVSPSGARAASAGVWIGEAADVLAMAPGTNIGSSTPISSSGQDLDKDLKRKVINDAAASLRSLMRYHHRNVAWADKAVRVASNLTEQEAKQMNVIDVVAPSLPALLRQLDGYRTKADDRRFVLHLRGAQIDNVYMGFFTRVLNTLIDPNLISILFLAGLAGLGYEIFHPGVVLPGALGAVSMVAALFGFSVLPISWAGIVLILLGVFLLGADVHVTSHGALTVAGLTSLVVGLLLLFHNAPSPYHTSVPLVASVAAVLGGFWAFAISKAIGARRHPVSVGPQTIVGEIGEVRRGGLVFVHGELWQAHTPDGSPLTPGQQVRVEQLDGLTLSVRPV
jgi:membrane-bound serine protease (ClpP class)